MTFKRYCHREAKLDQGRCSARHCACTEIDEWLRALLLTSSYQIFRHFIEA